MFHSMRRTKQELPREECIAALEQAKTGVLAVAGDDGYPYAVPLNFVYLDGKLYFHCARDGHKMDAIRRCDKVSFCVVTQDNIVESIYSTDYRSAVVFGRARELQDPAERAKALRGLIEKYCSGNSEESKQAEMMCERACVVEIAIERMTAKQSSERVRSGRMPE